MNKGQLDDQMEVLVPEFPLASYTATSLEWYNLAQRDIAEKKLISDKVTTPSVAEQAEYALPDNFIEIKKGGVFFNNVQLEPITLQGLIDNYGQSWKSTASGTPIYYLLSGGTIELFPKPNTSSLNLALDFWAYANDLVADADLPFTTGDGTAGYDYNNRLRSLDKLVLEYAIGMAKFSLGLYANTRTALANFYTLLEQRVQSLKKREDLEVSQIQPGKYHLRNMARRLNCSSNDETGVS